MHIADTLSRAYILGEPSVNAVALAKMDMTEVSPEQRASWASHWGGEGPREESSDVQLMLLNFRNTVRDGYIFI